MWAKEVRRPDENLKRIVTSKHRYKDTMWTIALIRPKRINKSRAQRQQQQKQQLSVVSEWLTPILAKNPEFFNFLK